MSTTEISLSLFFLIILLLLINAFFVASEFALVKMRPSQIEKLIQEGSSIADYIKRVTQDIDRTITSTQVGITFASIALGFVAEPFFASVLIVVIEWFTGIFGISATIDETLLASLSLFISYIWVVYLHVVIGELLPKTLSIQNVEKFAKACALPLYYLNKLFNPLINFFVGTNNLLIKLMKQDIISDTHTEAFTEEELKIILRNSIFDKGITQVEYLYIRNILEFNDMTVKSIVTPRIDVKALPISCTAEDLLKLAVDTGFSRIPIYTDDLDDVQKFVHIKDVLKYNLQENKQEFSIDQGLREVISVFQETAVNDLLNQMKQENIQLAVVFDEYGTFSGIVTIEDILEEIFGAINDEFDEELIHEVLDEENGSYIVGGLVSIPKFNNQVRNKYEVTIESDDSVTLAGYVLELFNSELPNVGDQIEDSNFNFQILDMTGKRIDRIKVTPCDDIPLNGTNSSHD